MEIIINSLIVLTTFFFMEFVAWATHKYVMHGFLWYLHEDHHEPHDHFFEKNDAFFLIFAVPSWLGIMLGMMYNQYVFVWIGVGIALYGLCYFLTHDVLIHRRFKWFDKTNNRYFRAIRKAHKVHHKNQGKYDSKCFGMLIVPKKYWEEAKAKPSRNKQKHRNAGAV
ncbi:sterol desaturase family protein [Flammeovirga yaeyamensis]|uniref:Sterol desaturase family protein n=1 Tax=Flammeovirga yaeyamensis TaxID=367791 RepID=A0AAX1NBG5_9BACT|nr:sterol desaturase family protein [Flammeovirga yaeyamensis]MBB3698970.1 beta-carotene 3-hydroxylase [Flammeovirga yaeyamensis]NMF36404.1 beta-carotene hydroxylase [Flammeovirga yaeyamensis]QWG03635.1 sterol desaturase family protein [Flammeovirga yaeyamensis]